MRERDAGRAIDFMSKPKELQILGYDGDDQAPFTESFATTYLRDFPLISPVLSRTNYIPILWNIIIPIFGPLNIEGPPRLPPSALYSLNRLSILTNILTGFAQRRLQFDCAVQDFEASVAINSNSTVKLGSRDRSHALGHQA
jgi:hypothetical protein